MVVLGGTSDLAGAFIEALGRTSLERLVLAGRDEGRLSLAAAAAKSAGVGAVATLVFDANDVSGAQSLVASCFELLDGDVDMVLVALGALSEQNHELDARYNGSIATVNFTWPLIAMTEAAARLRVGGKGSIVVCSSVAALRTRRANFAYGAAKAGLDAFSLGLADALEGSGVGLHVVRPGFVYSKMTKGLPPAPFATTPAAVANELLAGLARRQRVIWAPPVLRIAQGAIRFMPPVLWRRLS